MYPFNLAIVSLFSYPLELYTIGIVNPLDLAILIASIILSTYIVGVTRLMLFTPLFCCSIIISAKRSIVISLP